MGFGGMPTFKEAIYTAKDLSVTASARQLSSAHDKPLHKMTDKIEREVPEKGIVPPSIIVISSSSPPTPEMETDFETLTVAWG